MTSGTLGRGRPKAWSGSSWIVGVLIALIAAGCGRLAPTGPRDTTPPAGTTTPAASTVATGNEAAVDAFGRTSWTAIDPGSGDWIVGRGASANWLLELGEGNARADWGAVAFVRTNAGAASVGLATAESPSAAEFPIPFKTRTTDATVDRNTAYLFVHGGAQGRDEGVVAIEIATGRVIPLIDPGPIAPDDERNYLLWSPSGNTLFSTVCDLERCLVDVIDAASLSARRLAQPFPTVAATDAYLLGQDEGRWTVLDLAAGTTRPAAIDPTWDPRSIVAADDTHVLFDYQVGGQYVVGMVDLVTGTTTRVFTTADLGLRLNRLPVVDGRWAFLGPDGSISDSLARDGEYPSVAVLDIDSGTVDPERIRIVSTIR